MSRLSAMLIAISMKCAGAFIHSSGKRMQNNNTGHRNPIISSQLARTTPSPILHYSPSSAENAREEDIFSPYDDLFRSHLQHEQEGISKNKGTHIKHVHIILFNQGLQEEGIHCIEFPKNSGSNVILAFESYKDCQRFAKNLGSHTIDSAPAPQTQKIPTRNLNRYANELGMAVQVIPAGMNLKPPDRNYSGSMGNSGLMKLKEQKMYLDRLIGSSPSSSSGNAGDFGSLPAWG